MSEYYNTAKLLPFDVLKEDTDINTIVPRHMVKARCMHMFTTRVLSQVNLHQMI